MQLPLSVHPVSEAAADLSASSSARPLSSVRPGTPKAASPSASRVLGWRRRALLLLPPGFGEGLPPLEAQAALAMALAPMALPGGGGWKLNGLEADLGGQSLSPLQSLRSMSPGVSPSMTAGEVAEMRLVPAAAGGGEGGVTLGAPSSLGVRPPGGAWPALADVATAATLGLVRPTALVGQLPPELQVRVSSQQLVWGLVSKLSTLSKRNMHSPLISSLSCFPWLPHVSHISPTCLPHVSHISPTWLPHVSHMAPTWLPHGS